MKQLAPMALLAAFSMAPAIADLPPPADDYIGPRHVTLAGLNFEHRLAHYSRIIDHRGNPSFVLLVGCEDASANCDAVTKAGVISWEVIAVDGKPVAQGNLQTVIDAFARGRGKVRILFAHGTPPRTQALDLDRK